MGLDHFFQRRAHGCLLIGLSAVGCLAQAEEASETTGVVTNAPALSVNVRREVEGTFVPYRFAFVTAGLEKFTFLVPDSYRVDTSDPAKIKLASPDYSRLIVIGLGTSGLPAAAKLDAPALRAFVMEKYSAVTIKADQSCFANDQTAAGLDFSWKTDSGIVRMSRTTFIPTRAGLMEFTISASPEKFEASLAELNLVMLTFRSGVNGKFDYVVGSKNP